MMGRKGLGRCMVCPPHASKPSNICVCNVCKGGGRTTCRTTASFPSLSGQAAKSLQKQVLLGLCLSNRSGLGPCGTQPNTPCLGLGNPRSTESSGPRWALTQVARGQFYVGPLHSAPQPLPWRDKPAPRPAVRGCRMGEARGSNTPLSKSEPPSGPLTNGLSLSEGQCAAVDWTASVSPAPVRQQPKGLPPTMGSWQGMKSKEARLQTQQSPQTTNASRPPSLITRAMLGNAPLVCHTVAPSYPMLAVSTAGVYCCAS